MKIWILTIFRLAAEVGKQIDSLEKRIEHIAVNPFGITTKQYEKVLSLGDKRNRLINLRVMHEVICDDLTAEERLMLTRYAFGTSAAQLGEVMGYRVGAVYARIKRALAKAKKTLARCGYDEGRMINEYGEFGEVCSVMARLAVRSRGTTEKNQKKRPDEHVLYSSQKRA